MSTYEIISTITVFLLGIYSYYQHKRNVKNEILYEELKELATKIHDITNRADFELKKQYPLSERDYHRLIYFTRYKKHGKRGVDMTIKVKEYQKLWEKIDDLVGTEIRYYTSKKYNKKVSKFYKMSKQLRDSADKLLS